VHALFTPRLLQSLAISLAFQLAVGAEYAICELKWTRGESRGRMPVAVSSLSNSIPFYSYSACSSFLFLLIPLILLLLLLLSSSLFHHSLSHFHCCSSSPHWTTPTTISPTPCCAGYELCTECVAAFLPLPRSAPLLSFPFPISHFTCSTFQIVTFHIT